MNRMSALWARTALVWFVLAVCLGLFMGITQRFEFAPSHAHIGVLGWLSSGVFAFLYAVAREGRPGRGPFFHWAAYNIGVAAMTGGLFGGLGLGREAMMAVVPAGAILIVLSVLWATVTLWPRLRPGAD
ncbi:MAG TPA: hypothetical protein VEW25_01115 [Allosphingosinicella sp.]|nr:hypothetical protein [Allosphingosinicella sp.]